MSAPDRNARLAAAMRDMEGMVSDALNAMRVLEIVVRDAQSQRADGDKAGSGVVTLRLIEDQAVALDYALIHAGDRARALHGRFYKALEGEGAG